MIVWIDRALALAMHDRQLAEHGGGSGVRDEGMLDSALARPQQRHAYGDPPPDLADLAASLAFGLARNHPFVDGNKRVSLGACLVFLRLNGLEPVPDGPEWEELTFAVAASRLDRVQGAALLGTQIAPAQRGRRLPHQPVGEHGHRGESRWRLHR